MVPLEELAATEEEELFALEDADAVAVALGGTAQNVAPSWSRRERARGVVPVLSMAPEPCWPVKKKARSTTAGCTPSAATFDGSANDAPGEFASGALEQYLSVSPMADESHSTVMRLARQVQMRLTGSIGPVASKFA